MDVEQLKIKRLVSILDSYEGNGTSMISLYIPQNHQIALSRSMLVEESGKASNIQSRVNRLSVQSAIDSTLHTLKLYNHTPPNGLIVFCGHVILEDGKEKKININFSPYKPINVKKYICDSRFHTDELQSLLEIDKTYAYIIIDGNGSLFGTVSGSTKTTLSKIKANLSGKTARGGQSANRYEGIRRKEKHDYLKEVCEKSAILFLERTLGGIIIAGCANFKNKLYESQMFDDRLKKQVIGVIDVSYPYDNGFQEAFEKSLELISNEKIREEKKILEQYFACIAKDDGKYCFCIEDTLLALEMGAIDNLIIWEKLDSTRNNELVLDYVLENYDKYGASLTIISDVTALGTQFVNAFGGIGAILRYKVNFDLLAE